MWKDQRGSFSSEPAGGECCCLTERAAGRAPVLHHREVELYK